jgi:hypothetical protein
MELNPAAKNLKSLIVIYRNQPEVFSSDFLKLNQSLPVAGSLFPQDGQVY